MPQPSHDAEVENVLSAIRRLIEEGGQGPGAPLERLVLTPAQRVAATPEPLVLAIAEEAPETLPATSDPLVLLNALPPAGVTPPPIPSDPGETFLSGDAGEGRAPEPPLPAQDPDLADLSSDPGAAEAALAEDLPDAALSAPEPSGHPESEPPTLMAEGLPSSDPEPIVAPAALVPEEPSADLRPDPAPEPTPAWPDEAALRGLVADVLRQELRGELGERLTRNLRKLVRQEVRQALALRDL